MKRVQVATKLKMLVKMYMERALHKTELPLPPEAEALVADTLTEVDMVVRADCCCSR